MAHQLEFAYIGVEVSDPAALGEMLTGMVGLLPGEVASDGSPTFRNDDRSRRVFIQEGPRNDCSVLGFEATSDEAFEKVAAQLEGAGFALTEGDQDLAVARGVSRIAYADSPWRPRFELALGLGNVDVPFFSPLVRGGFQTEGVGAGHTALAVTSFEDSERFLLDGLGMVQSDWVETELWRGSTSRFASTTATRVITRSHWPNCPSDLGKSLHHFQVETNERDDVGFAFDRAWAAGYEIANGLGLHDNEGAFSFYATSPGRVSRGSRLRHEEGLRALGREPRVRPN